MEKWTCYDGMEEGKQQNRRNDGGKEYKGEVEPENVGFLNLYTPKLRHGFMRYHA